MLNDDQNEETPEKGLERGQSSTPYETTDTDVPQRENDDRNEDFENNVHMTIDGMTASSDNDRKTETEASHKSSGGGHWKVLLAGQLLSLGVFASGAVNSSLSLDCNLSAPTFQSIFLYFFLSLHLLPCCRNLKIRYQLEEESRDTPRHTGEVRIPSDDEDAHINDESSSHGCSVDNDAQHSMCGKCIKLHAPAWVYFIRALLDVEANFFTFLGYRYTTFSSATLFDSLAIPSSMVFSRLLLGRKYQKVHLLGSAICMAGVLSNVMTDYRQDNQNDVKKVYPNKTLGDLYTIIGGILYGLNDVLSEIAVKNFGGIHEYLGMIGIFGFIISIIQSMAIETDEIKKYFQDSSTTHTADHQLQGNDDSIDNLCTVTTGWLLMMVYVTAMYLSYVGGALFLKISEAALFNLSLLTADFWSVIFTIVVQHILPQSMFWVALFFIVAGVCIYEIAPSPLSDKEELHFVQNNGWKKILSNFLVGKKTRNDHNYANNNTSDPRANTSMDNDDDVWAAYDDDFNNDRTNFTIT